MASQHGLYNVILPPLLEGLLGVGGDHDPAQVKEGFCHGVSHPVNPSSEAYPDPVFSDLPGDPVILAWRAPTLPPRCRGSGLHPVSRLKNGEQVDSPHSHLGDERTKVLPRQSLDAIALTDQLAVCCAD